MTSKMFTFLTAAPPYSSLLCWMLHSFTPFSSWPGAAGHGPFLIILCFLLDGPMLRLPNLPFAVFQHAMSSFYFCHRSVHLNTSPRCLLSPARRHSFSAWPFLPRSGSSGGPSRCDEAPDRPRFPLGMSVYPQHAVEFVRPLLGRFCLSPPPHALPTLRLWSISASLFCYLVPFYSTRVNYWCPFWCYCVLQDPKLWLYNRYHYYFSSAVQMVLPLWVSFPYPGLPPARRYAGFFTRAACPFAVLQAAFFTMSPRPRCAFVLSPLFRGPGIWCGRLFYLSFLLPPFPLSFRRLTSFRFSPHRDVLSTALSVVLVMQFFHVGLF